MLGNLTEPRDRLIYAHGLLRVCAEQNIADKVLSDALDDVMNIMSDVVNNYWMYPKKEETRNE